MRIWNGLPSNPASQVVYDDMTVNAMTSTSWTNAYRVSETTLNNQRAIMKVVCSTPGLVLQPGQYWVEWSATGSTTSGPWGVPVTINGQTTTGDAIQFNTSTSTWSPLLRGGTNTPYGMSFLVEGTATTPQPQWLSVSPTSGSVNAGASTNLSVTFSSTGLQTGTYNANIVITSNDPATPTKTVPITLTVSSNTLSVTPSNQNVGSAAGSTSFSVNSNTGLTVMENVSWLGVSPLSGSGNDTLTVTYDANL